MAMPSKGDRTRFRVPTEVVEQLKSGTGRPNLPTNTVVSDFLCLLAGRPDLAEVLTAEDLPRMLSPTALARVARLTNPDVDGERPGQTELFDAEKVPA